MNYTPYVILRTNSDEDMAALVNVFMTRGYRFMGNLIVVVNPLNNVPTYIREMVRPDPEPERPPTTSIYPYVN